MSVKVSCSCSRIHVGMKVTDARNWNPDCPEHGSASDWYQSPEQVAKRKTQNDRLLDLYQQAKQRRGER